MTTKTVNILALLIAVFAVFAQIYISKMINKTIKKIDERAKRIMDRWKKNKCKGRLKRKSSGSICEINFVSIAYIFYGIIFIVKTLKWKSQRVMQI